MIWAPWSLFCPQSCDDTLRQAEKEKEAPLLSPATGHERVYAPEASHHEAHEEHEE